MKNLTVDNILECTKGKFFGDENLKSITVEGVVLDSRKVEPGFCFVATVGERVDGHSFIPQVIEKGAKLVICEKAPDSSLFDKCAFIQVEDSFVALKKIAEFYRMQLTIPFIGITGSVGKTSTKEYIAGTLSAKYKVLKTEGNFNNEVGVPLTILSIRDYHEIAVVEMGINHFGEMSRLSQMVKPNVVVMTNIGECHLEHLGSLEGVLQAKSEIFEYIDENGTVFINGEDQQLLTIEKVKHKKPLTFGLTSNCDYYADNIVNDGLVGTNATIHLANGNEIEAQIGQPGLHMVRNAVIGAAIGEAFGLTQTEIAQGIASVMAVGGRSNIINKLGVSVIDDCYNANPVSVKTSLDLLALGTGKKIAILGDMFELGRNEEILHEEIGVYAVRKNVDVLICIGNLSRRMYKGACAEKVRTCSNSHIQYYETVDEFLNGDKTGSGIVNRNDKMTILIKASHGMKFSQIVDNIIYQLDKNATFKAFYE